MADNPVFQSATLATLPVGTTPAADDVTVTGMAGPALVQFVKLVDGTANGTSPIAGDATNGLDVDVTRLPALPAGTNNIGDVDVLTVPAPLSTTGGGTEAAALRVTLANDSTGLVSVDDNGGSLTVDGTVAISGSVAVTNAGTFATQDSQTIVDNAAFTDGTSRVFTAGYIFDEVAGTALTENDAAAARVNSNRAQIGVIEDGVTRARYATVSAANALKVDGSAVTQPVSGTVTANLAAGVNNIGDVDVLTMPGTFAEDAGHTTGATGLLVLGVRNDALAAATNADADYGYIALDDAGAARTNERRATGTPTEGAFTATVDTQILASTNTRKQFSIANDCDQNLFIRYGPTAVSATAYKAKIVPGGFFADDGWTGEVRGILAGAIGSGQVRFSAEV